MIWRGRSHLGRTSHGRKEGDRLTVRWPAAAVCSLALLGCVSQNSDLQVELILPTNQDPFDGAEILRVTATAGDSSVHTDTNLSAGVPAEIKVPRITIGGSVRVVIEAFGPESQPGVRPLVSRGRSVPVELGGGRNATVKVFFGRVGEFGEVGHMAVARADHAAVALPDGRVLLAGGFTDAVNMEASAEIFNPATGQLESTGGMFVANARQVGIIQADGTVVLSGGEADAATGVGHLAIFETNPDRFSSPVGTGASPRLHHTAAPIPGGALLVGGGLLAAGSLAMLTDNAQAYRPQSSATVEPVPTLTARAYGTATTLDDGRVLLFGGLRSEEAFPTVVPFGIDWVAPELFDPVTDTATPLTGFALELRYAHTTVKLSNGSVVILGGFDADTIDSVETPLSFVALFDPGPDSLSRIDSLERARARAPAALLEDGRVLVVGGVSPAPLPGSTCEQGGGGQPYVPVNSAEVYDPATGSQLTDGCLSEPRVGHSVTPLPDGTVLVAGGWTRTDGAGVEQDPTDLLEIYVPE